MQAVGQELSEERQESWKQWLRRYKTVLKSEGQSDEQRIQQQNSSNPCYVPRNHLLQKAIEKAEVHDFSEVQCATLLSYVAAQAYKGLWNLVFSKASKQYMYHPVHRHVSVMIVCPACLS